MDFIEGFVKATEHLPSPEVYRRWTAIGLVSALMSRRVWTSLGSGLVTYPNLFIFVVGGPTSGKSVAIKAATEIITSVPMTAKHVALTPDDATPQSLIKRAVPYFRGVQEDENDEGVWSYNAIISEIGNFMAVPDLKFLQQLARWWDCPDDWGKDTVGRGSEPLHKPYFTMLAGAQVTWVNQLFSQDIVGLGLPSRLLFITTDNRKPFSPFEDVPNPEQYNELRKLVPQIVNFAGFCPFTKDAKALLKRWWDAGKPGADGQPYLGEGQMEDYAGRRHEHLTKIALVIAGSRHPDNARVLDTDLQTAMDTLFAAETSMPKVVSSFGGNPYKMREDAILRRFGIEYTKRGKGYIPEAEIRMWLAQAIPSQHEGMVLENMINRGVLHVKNQDAKAPGRLLSPGMHFPK